MRSDHNEAIALHRWAVIAEAAPARLTPGERGAVVRAIAAATGALPADIIKMRDDYESYFVDVITDGVTDGQFRRVRPRLASKEVLGALNWIMIWYTAGARDDAPQVIAQEFADFVTRGLLSSTPSRAT